MLAPRSKTTLGIAGVLVLVFFLSAPLIASANTLYYGLGFGDLGSLDPHLSPATQDVIINDAMYNGLVRFQPGNLDPEAMEPDLAESWEVSDDGLTWTFHLRKGVQFHHGYGELTAEDVVFSLTKAASPDRSAFAARYEAFERIEALDRYTVRITLSRPIPFVLGPLANIHGGMIISKKAYEEMGEDFRLHGVGTGPFQFVEYVPGSRVVLERHDDYFRGPARLERVVFQFMPDVRSRQLAFEAGEVHMMTGQSEQWWIDEMERKGAIADPIGPGELATLHFNMSMGPMADHNLRAAIAHAINREELMEFVGTSATAPAPSIVPPAYLGFTDEGRQYEYDPQKSRELLAAAGFPNGINLGTVLITELESMRRPMEVIHDQLRRAGINFNLQVVDHPTYHARIRDNVNPIVLYYASRFPVADVYLKEFYHSDSIVGKPTAVTNFSHYDAIDAYIDEAAWETDQARQLELWRQAQLKAMEDLPALPLYVRRAVYVRHPNVDLGYEMVSNLVNGYQVTENTAVLD